MGAVRQFIGNYYLLVAVLSWFSAQVLKVIFTLITKKKFVSERFWGSGGMPSSHSAMVCSLAIAISRGQGFSSPEFAIAFVLACIVMYDATGVRRETGKQAVVIKQLVRTLEEEEALDDEKNDEELFTDLGLKEFVGHTPFEVLGGALLGILIAMIIPLNR